MADNRGRMHPALGKSITPLWISYIHFSVLYFFFFFFFVLLRNRIADTDSRDGCGWRGHARWRKGTSHTSHGMSKAFAWLTKVTRLSNPNLRDELGIDCRKSRMEG